MRLVLIAGLGLMGPGCIFLHYPNAPVPAGYAPTTHEGERSWAIDFDAGRNLAHGVAVDMAGEVTPDTDDAPPSWGGASLMIGGNLSDRIGWQVRGVTNLNFPMVLWPGGWSLSPSFRLWEPNEQLQLTVSPRFVRARGDLFLAGPSTDDQITVKAWGAEAPLQLMWRPTLATEVAFSGWGRAFLMGAMLNEDNVEGTPGRWVNGSGGVAVTLAGRIKSFRVALTVAGEGGTPGTPLMPAGGLSLGGHWNRNDRNRKAPEPPPVQEKIVWPDETDEPEE